MKLCKCGEPVEAERYKFCYECWWSQDPRNTKDDWRKRRDKAALDACVVHGHDGEPVQDQWAHDRFLAGWNAAMKSEGLIPKILPDDKELTYKEFATDKLKEATAMRNFLYDNFLLDEFRRKYEKSR